MDDRDLREQPLSRTEIGALLDVLRSPEEGLGVRDKLELVLRCDRAFAVLERQFQADAGPLRELVEELKALRSRNDARRVDVAAALADEFQRVRQASAELEARLETIRHAMIRVCTLTGLGEIHGEQACVAVRARVGREVPKAGNPLRAVLESALRRLGVWEDVVVVSAPRLVKMLQDRGQDARVAELRAMCPEKRTWEVRLVGSR